MILLDTDHLTLLQWGGEAARKIEKRLNENGVGDAFPAAIISYEEQFRGWTARISAAKSVADEVRLYEKLAAQLQFFATLEIIPFDEQAATEFQRLKKLKLRMGTMDLKIASISLARGLTLFTRNVVDFSRVPALKIEDASV